MKKKLLTYTLLLFSTLLFGQGAAGCWRVISAGQNFSMAVKTDGTLWGWGQNSNRLGLGLANLADQNLPTQIGTANDWLTVSAGAAHTLAVKTNGTLWAWGNGQFGQLGNGIFNSATPNVTQVGTANDWVEVSAGNRFSLAIKNNGTLWAWGWNNTGQLGLNNLIDQNLPIQVGTANDWLRIDAGDQHSLGVKTTGTLWAWGNNTSGQLGDGTNTNSLIPIQIGTLNNWLLVSAGVNHSIATDNSNFLYTWGDNTNGELGDGTNTSNNSPNAVSFSTDGTPSLCIAISAGNTDSLIIKSDNTLWSSGFNSSGQLGLGNNTNVNAFNQVGTGNTWQGISAGDIHSLALETTLDLWSTGRNFEGQLGIGTNTAANTLQSVTCPTSALSNNSFVLNSSRPLVSPNPTNGFFNLNYYLLNPSAVTFKLTTIQGQVISEFKSNKSNGFHTEVLDISSQSKGVYFLTIINDIHNLTLKVIKD
ncbi:T9SS type A sorting domain-containing protein [Flavobacterium sp.]|uniref:T9SS type A sorting domain-containing protein n=1 Tax=Flavobacterium sp. TaxID=239 RepID=UPI0039193A04